MKLFKLHTNSIKIFCKCFIYIFIFIFNISIIFSLRKNKSELRFKLTTLESSKKQKLFSYKNNLSKNHSLANLNTNFTLTKILMKIYKKSNTPDNINLILKNNKILKNSTLNKLNITKSVKCNQTTINSIKIFNPLTPLEINQRAEFMLTNLTKYTKKVDTSIPSKNLNFRKETSSNNKIFIYSEKYIDISKLSDLCLETQCQWCDIKTGQICNLCKYGFFLHENKCYTICPKNYIADIYRRTCNPLDNTSKIILN